MKKIVAIIFLVILLGIIYTYRERFLSNSLSPRCPTNEIWDEGTKQCVRLGTVAENPPSFKVEEIERFVLPLENKQSVEITRKQGAHKLEAQFRVTGSPIEGIVVLLEEHTVHNSNTGDIFIPYVANYGGSGSFVSIGLFAQEGTTLHMQDSMQIGDRVLIDKLSIEGNENSYTVHINFRDRALGEAMAAPPTILKELSLHIRNHLFEDSPTVTPNVTYYNDLITVHSPVPNQTISSPLTVSGEARGSWFFEATFPVVVVDWDGQIIGEGHAEAQKEWMTASYVPFTGTISFTVPSSTTNRRGAVIFKKSNASDLEEHDDAVEIPILFQ